MSCSIKQVFYNIGILLSIYSMPVFGVLWVVVSAADVCYCQFLNHTDRAVAFKEHLSMTAQFYWKSLPHRHQFYNLQLLLVSKQTGFYYKGQVLFYFFQNIVDFRYSRVNKNEAKCKFHYKAFNNYARETMLEYTMTSKFIFFRFWSKFLKTIIHFNVIFK